MTLVFAMIMTAAFAGNNGTARQQLDRFTIGLETLQANFIQTIRSPDGSIQDQSQGEIWLSNPDRLRWVYSGEFPEVIVADGTNIWIYDEVLEQVSVKPQSPDASDAPLMILMDASRLDLQFNVTEVGDYEGMQLLELRSRDPESEFERILIGLGDAGIRMMTMEDAFGQRTELVFDDIARNTGLDPVLFTFTPPEGVDVFGEISSVK
jgi:outer membrane lipoprotein carrier protein